MMTPHNTQWWFGPEVARQIDCLHLPEHLADSQPSLYVEAHDKTLKRLADIFRGDQRPGSGSNLRTARRIDIEHALLAQAVDQANLPNLPKADASSGTIAALEAVQTHFGIRRLDLSALASPQSDVGDIIEVPYRVVETSDTQPPPNLPAGALVW